jgi:hypothetical protein
MGRRRSDGVCNLTVDNPLEDRVIAVEAEVVRTVPPSSHSKTEIESARTQPWSAHAATSRDKRAVAHTSFVLRWGAWARLPRVRWVGRRPLPGDLGP